MTESDVLGSERQIILTYLHINLSLKHILSGEGKGFFPERLAMYSWPSILSILRFLWSSHTWGWEGKHDPLLLNIELQSMKSREQLQRNKRWHMKSSRRPKTSSKIVLFCKTYILASAVVTVLLQWSVIWILFEFSNLKFIWVWTLFRWSRIALRHRTSIVPPRGSDIRIGLRVYSKLILPISADQVFCIFGIFLNHKEDYKQFCIIAQPIERKNIRTATDSLPSVYFHSTPLLLLQYSFPFARTPNAVLLWMNCLAGRCHLHGSLIRFLHSFCTSPVYF